MNTQTITLGGGCFWCLEAVFDRLEGVTDVVSGYAGGRVPNPSYKEVCSGQTGHAEVVRVTFDADVIALPEVLDVFFAMHDPTTLNRQGADVGTQYRSAIYYEAPEHETVATETIAALNAADIWSNPIVTEVAPLDIFYPAEDYHQEYFARNPNQGYCRVVVAPKVSKLRQKFSHRLKA